MKKYSCIGFLARSHGIAVFEALVRSEQYTLSAVFTHARNPKMYDAERKIRPDFEKFQEIAQKNEIPFYSVDTRKENAAMEVYVKQNSFDLLVSVSWRRLVLPCVFERAAIGAVNVHRGDLPKYAGAEPIRRALEAKEEYVAVCAHAMTEKIDAGEVLAREVCQVKYDARLSLEENVELLKENITPLFPAIVMNAFELLIKKKEK